MQGFTILTHLIQSQLIRVLARLRRLTDPLLKLGSIRTYIDQNHFVHSQANSLLVLFEALSLNGNKQCRRVEIYEF